MVENFDVREVEKFAEVLDEYCCNTTCSDCIFKDIQCEVLEGENIEEIAKLMHSWAKGKKIEKSAKPLTETQITYLKALATLGVRYLAKNATGEVFMYIAYPQKRANYWITNDFNAISEDLEKGHLASLGDLCDWRDEEPFNIVASVAEKRTIYGKKEEFDKD